MSSYDVTINNKYGINKYFFSFKPLANAASADADGRFGVCSHKY